LEERVLLDIGLAPALVVGRTLSSYTTAGVQNNQLTITYTVYNESPDPETGALLTDTLQPGVTFQSAMQLPDQNGQQLAWSLGTIEGFDRASVTLTVGLNSPIPLQLDVGAQAFATLNASAVSSSTPAATLRQGSVDPTLLASTPDANTTDSFVQEKAAELHYDPQQIFNYLHNDIGYNSYTGSLRGARGTLWSGAGNALDVASLGVALMRASGIPAQYEPGTLSQSQAQTLILSMFPANYQAIGYIPAGTQTADPAHDPQMLAETESHYWFQFDAGSGMKDADPLLAGAMVGQSFTASTGTFTEVADSLRQKTEVKLTAEIYEQGTAQFGLGDGLARTVVLDQTFNDVELVGHPLVFGNLVDVSGSGAVAFGSTVYTYTPYLEVGDVASPDPSQYQMLLGSPYQDVLTNVPLSSRILTGLFLDVTVTGPQVPAATYDRALFDRIGYAARQGLVPVPVTTEGDLGPAMTNADLTVIDVLAGDVPASLLTVEQVYAAALQQRIASLSAEFNQLNQSSPDPGELAAIGQELRVITAAALTSGLQSGLDQFAVESGYNTGVLARSYSVRAYQDGPRVIVSSTHPVQKTATDSVGLAVAIDMVADRVRAVPAPGQAVTAAYSFNLTRGIEEAAIEGIALGAASPGTNSPVTPGVDTSAVFAAAAAQGVPTILVSRDNASVVGTLPLSAEAKARITDTIAAGDFVIIPAAMVDVGGKTTVAWYRVNPVTGETIGVLENGANSFAGLAAVLKTIAITTANFLFSVKNGPTLNAFVYGTAITLLGGFIAYLSGLTKHSTKNAKGPALVAEAEQVVIFTAIAYFVSFKNPDYAQAFKSGIGLGASIITALILKDPPVPEALVGPAAPPTSNEAGADVTVPAGGSISGAAAGAVAASSVAVSGSIVASWSSSSLSSLSVTSLNAPSGTILSSSGQTVGTGTVALASATGLPVSVTGTDQFAVHGAGSLSVYGPAETSLGVSGIWDNYAAAVTGNVTITLTTDGLSLNGQALPAGTYTITTNSATLAGSGNTASPSFAGSASVTLTNGTVNLGLGSGNVTLGGNSLNLSSGGTLTGYTGSIAVMAGGGSGSDDVMLNGNADNVLTLSATPALPSTDQNTPVTFQVNVNTSLADTYAVRAEAPPGWTTNVSASGNVTVTPAPGTQGGTYPIRVVARSTTNADLVAQTTVGVTVTPTSPGVTLTVAPDTLYTVPYTGAQLPTAFRASIDNTGPAADTFNLSFANLPAGFSLLSSGTSVTVAAGQTGILGVYLQPNGAPLPAPGTVLTFDVTATSASNPAVTQTVTESFTVPPVDAVTVAATPVQVTSTPGAPTTATLTLVNVGNVSENVTLAATAPTDLTVSGLSPMPLDPGKTATETITLTPDASATLNDTLAATITATYGQAGAPLTASTQADVLVRSPQTVAVSQAAVAATQGNNSDLAANLSSLGDIIAQLQATPTDPGSCGRATFLLGNLSALLSADPALASFVSQLQPLQAKASACDGTGLLALVPAFFNSLTSTLAIEATQQFTVTVSPNEVDLQPGQGQNFSVQLTNTGSDSVSLTLSTPGLPNGVTANLGQTQVALAAGATDTIPLTLSQTLVSSKIFTLDVTAAASVAQQTATAVIAVRPAAADVTGVTLSATTIQAGTPESISAQVFNTANVARSVLAHVDVLDGSDAVVSSLPDVPVTLTPGSDSQTLSLGSVATTGLANGAYAVRVSLRTTDGAALPGHSSLAPFVVGLPLTASVSASATKLPPGTSTVTTTITVADPVPAGPPTGGDPGPTGGSGTPPSGGDPVPPSSPPVADDALTWIGGTSGDWNVAANWLDTTNNTNLVPTATDAVTINTAGATVTINNTQQTALSIQVAAGSTLTLTNNAFLTLGPNSSEVDGSLTVESSTLTLGGALTLAGTSQWLNTSTNDALYLDGQTLTNRGAMTVGDAAGGTLQLLLHGGFSSGTLLNKGTITQQGTTDVSIDTGVVVNNSSSGIYNLAGNGRTDGFVNAGLVRKTAGTGTSSLGAVFHDLPLSLTGGTLQVDTGTLLLRGNSDGAVVAASTGGSLVVATGATLDLSDLGTNSTFTGTYTGSGAGTVLFAGGGNNLLIGSGGATFNFPAGMFQWTGGTINLQGNTLTNAGSMTLGSATASTTETLETRTGISTIVPGGRLLNLGTIVQQGAGSLNIDDTAVVDNHGTYQLTGAGTIHDGSSISGPASAFDNAGTLTMTGTGTADVTTTLDNSGTALGQGGTLLLEGAVTNTGTIAADGAAVTVQGGTAIDGNRLDNGPGTWIARNGGTLTFSGSRPIVYNQVNLVADGAGSTIAGLSNLATNAGTLALTNGASLSISANLDNLGTIALGPGGTLNITGSYTQDAAGTLDVQLGGAPASGAFGTLTATQTATLGGLLRAELVGGYTPAVGDAFAVLTSAGASGTFAGEDLPATATTAFQAAVHANALALTAQSAILTPTSVALTSDAANGATFGQRLTFTATVQAAGGAGTPTGAVQFQIDGANVGAPVPLDGGSARLTTTLDVGSHTVAAVYLSAASFAASDDVASPLRLTVNPGASATDSGETLYFTQFGGQGPPQGVSQASLSYDGTTLTTGTQVPIETSFPGDGLLFLPNGDLLIGGMPVQEIDPTTGAVLASVNVEGDHLALDPSGLKVWTSAQGGFLGSPGGPLEELDLTHGLAEVTHPVQGDDHGVTQLAFDTAGNAYYTNEGDFGVIDLTTFTTRRLFDHLPSAHGLCFDPYTGDLIMVNNSNIMQFDPRTGTIASSLTIPGISDLDQGAADGQGHLFVGANDGHLLFVDYSATGLVGDPRDFVAMPNFAAHLDDVAPLSSLGSPGTPITVNDQLPSTGYAIDPSSVVPEGALSSSGLVWHGQIPAGSRAPLTFQVTGQVTNLAPGEARPISLGTTVTAVVGGPGGSVVAVPIQLPPVFVTADHVINLTPTARSGERGSSATYTITLSNPLPTPQTYTLSIDGLTGVTANLAPSVTVNPGQTTSVPLQLMVPDNAIPGTQAFEVLAQTAAGASDSVEGQLTILPGVMLPSLAVNLTLTPAQAVAGQSNPASYTLTVTNTGDSTDTYSLASVFPAGFTGTFTPQTIVVPPGVSNFRDVQLTLTPPANAPAGNDPFTVTATSATDATVQATASGTATVVGSGVQVTLTPSSATPGSPFQLLVTNTGQASDTFDLSLGGPGGLAASLGSTKVTLAPGASQMVPITTSALDFAVPGSLPLTGMAQSEANPAVQASALGSLTIAGSQAMTAAFSPATQVVTVPGTTSFLLMVQNTGNTEDSYSATITGTDRPLTASLTGLDGQPTQTISLFRLPGLSTGAILVNTSLASMATGTVHVQVQSLSDGSLVATPMATVAPVMPGTVQFSAPTYNVNENGGTATITLTRAGGSTGAVSVQVNTADNSAHANVDYTAVSPIVSWADSDTSAKTITVPILDAHVVGGQRTVNLSLSNASGAPLGTPATAVLTIVDNDTAQPTPGTVQFSAASYSANENGGQAVITLTRAAGSNSAVSVQVSTADGSATADTDYTALSQTVSWADGDSSPKSIVIPILDAFVVGGQRTVNLTLSAAGGGASLGSPSSAVLTIVDNDIPGPAVVLTGTQVQRSGKRGVPVALVLTFSGPLTAGVAATSTHYKVYTRDQQKHVKKRQLLVNVLAASYDRSRFQVTLKIGKAKNRKTLGTLEVLGLMDVFGRPGGNSDVSVNLQSKPRKH
jgi:uncharacterized membrane protein